MVKKVLIFVSFISFFYNKLECFLQVLWHLMLEIVCKVRNIFFKMQEKFDSFLVLFMQ